MPKSFAVTATPCSGTHYTLDSFRSCGLFVGAEKEMSQAGQVAWTSVLAPRDSCDVWFHQTRDPVKSISSIQRYGQYEGFRDEIDEKSAGKFSLRYSSTLQWCAEFWIEWNLMCENVSDYHYRIEDIDREWSLICNIIGINNPLPGFEKNKNSIKGQYTPRSIEDIKHAISSERFDQLLNQSRRYGYDY